MRTMLPRGIPPPSSLFSRSRSPSPNERRLSWGISVPSLHAELEQLLVAVCGEVHPVVAVVEAAVVTLERVRVDGEPQHVAAAPGRALVGGDEFAVDRARRDVPAVEDDVEA